MDLNVELDADRTVFMGTDHVGSTTSLAISSPRGRGRRKAHVYWPEGSYGRHTLSGISSNAPALTLQ